MEDNDLKFIGKRHKPLCVTEKGLLTYYKNAMYLFKNGEFSLLCKFRAGTKQRVLSSVRLAERFGRTEPQSAIACSDTVYIARHKEILCISLKTGEITERYTFRKPYIHTSRLTRIQSVPSFTDVIAFGEYFANEKREEVCLWTKNADNTCEWRVAYTFPAGKVRHIHNLVPDPTNNCVYILTGDEDGESGIWKATDDFRSVEPLLVGDQAYRACIAFADGKGITFATDIPSRQNYINYYDIKSGTLTPLSKIPGSCTSGCMINGKKIFCTTVESVEPKSRSKIDMIRYMLSRKRAAGIADDYSHIFVETEEGKYTDQMQFKKDVFPGGAFRFGSIGVVASEDDELLYLYPCAVKKYDGKLFSWRLM